MFNSKFQPSKEKEVNSTKMTIIFWQVDTVCYKNVKIITWHFAIVTFLPLKCTRKGGNVICEVLEGKN